MLETSDYISIASISITLIFSIYSVYLGYNQNKLNKIAERLNELQIQKELDDLQSRNSANIFVNHFKSSSNSYKMKISNIGNSSARNLVLKKLDNSNLICSSDINNKFPHSKLNSKESIQLNLNVSFGCELKAHFVVEWEDDLNESNSKDFHISI